MKPIKYKVITENKALEEVINELIKKINDIVEEINKHKNASDR